MARHSFANDRPSNRASTAARSQEWGGLSMAQHNARLG